MKPKYLWPGIIIGLLAFSVITQITLVLYSASDPSFALDPEYSADSRTWDEKQKQTAINTQLGWTVDLTTTLDPAGGVAVAVELFDRWGKPIKDATVAFESFHLARANRVKSGALAHVADGRYEATLDIVRSGQWEWRLAIDREADHFTHTIRTNVLAPARTVARIMHEAERPADEPTAWPLVRGLM